MKYTIVDGSSPPQPCESALSAGYHELEAASAPLFRNIETLDALNSTLNDARYWATFPRRHPDGKLEEERPTRLKLLAAWQSAKLAYLEHCLAVRTLAESLIFGPVAAARQYVNATGFCSREALVYRANNIICAAQLASFVLDETKRMSDVIRQCAYTGQAQAALEELFERSFPYPFYSGCPGDEDSPDGRRLGPPLSDQMMYVPCQLELLRAPANLALAPHSAELLGQVPELLKQAEAETEEMRRCLDGLTEHTFGARLQKVLTKPAELKEMLAQQHARRCHLASLLSHVQGLRFHLDINVLRQVERLCNAYVEAAKSENQDRHRRLIFKNNALFIVQTMRRVESWIKLLGAELKENHSVYDIAQTALLSALRGEEPTPKHVAAR